MRRRLRKSFGPGDPSPLVRGRVPMAALIQTLAVAEYMNMRHAANALSLSQSGVSARVRTLEEDLGVRLFERHARGVTLTEAGKRFIEGVGDGLDQIDYTVRTIGAMARGECGRLRVGVHALIPGGFLSDLIERYREQHPGIDVVIAEGTARESVMQLRAERLDLTFVADSPEIPDCHTRHIWNERLLAVLPTSHPLADREGIAWADLADETFLVRRGGTGPQVHDHIALRLAGRLPPPTIQRFAVERLTLLSMVSQGYGVTFVGETQVLTPIQGVSFLPITDEPEPLAFSAVWSPYNRSPALRNMLALADQMRRQVTR